MCLLLINNAVTVADYKSAVSQMTLPMAPPIGHINIHMFTENKNTC
jgi:hypothetical protein